MGYHPRHPEACCYKETDYMAQKIIREFIDDIDGSEAERTFTFAVDGTNYESNWSGRRSVIY